MRARGVNCGPGSPGYTAIPSVRGIVMSINSGENMGTSMRAVVVTPKQANSAKIADVPAPKPRPHECLVRVLEVGIDGTDRDINAGRYGEPPAGEKALILGHESLGEIIEPAGNFKTGDLVVATVRRPCPERCPPCREKTYDFCSSGNYEERGIRRRNGYLAECYAEHPEFLIPIPKALRHIAVLLEPMSIVEKAFRQVAKIQERMPWKPQRVLITGAGGVGTLGACVARLRGFETVVYSRSASRGTGHEIRKQLGVTDFDAQEYKLADAIASAAPDIVIEATGSGAFGWQAAEAVAVNGVVCLLSVTGGKEHIDNASARPTSRSPITAQSRVVARSSATMASCTGAAFGTPAQTPSPPFPLIRRSPSKDIRCRRAATRSGPSPPSRPNSGR